MSSTKNGNAPLTSEVVSEDPRMLRGLQIAAVSRIRRDGDGFIVPSQSVGGGRYRVSLAEGVCDCPDYATRGPIRCKHQWAAFYFEQRETQPDGSTVVTRARVTVERDWRAYSANQIDEAEHFPAALADLCSLIPQPEQQRGRPRLSLADMLFCATLKVHSTKSSRRFHGMLHEAQAVGFIERVPAYNTISAYLSDPTLTPILHELITISSLPLKAVESTFAVDSTGFSASGFITWYARQHKRMLDNHAWIKAHAMVGTTTGIVTSVEISPWQSNDYGHLPSLVEHASGNFDIREVSADKQYLGRSNLNAIESVGGVPYVPFKVNSLLHARDAGSAWERAYHTFALHREDFLARYHRRSMVESVFGGIKARYGGSVRSKSTVGQQNEVLCKVLSWNLVTLLRAMHVTGLEVDFGQRAQLPGK